MTSIVYKTICTIIIILQLRTTTLIYVNGTVGSYCRLENRTVILNICKTPPRFTLRRVRGVLS